MAHLPGKIWGNFIFSQHSFVPLHSVVRNVDSAFHG